MLEKNMILAIDPGPEISGVVLYGADTNLIFFADDMSTEELENQLVGGSVNGIDFNHTACEDIVSYMQSVGKTTFDTCKVIGDIRTICKLRLKKTLTLIKRPDVKTVLAGGQTYRCEKTGSRKGVSDAMIKNIIKSRFLGTGGGATPTIGTKAQPGPLFGMKGKKHAWSALAIALVYVETGGFLN